MSTQDTRLARWQELAADAAIHGLDAEASAEVATWSADDRLAFTTLRDELEVLAGELTAATIATDEALPRALTDRLAALATRSTSTPARASVEKLPAPTSTVRSSGRLVGVWLLAAAVLLGVAWSVVREPVRVAARASGVTTKRVDRPDTARSKLLAIAGTQRTPWKRTNDADAVRASGDVVWHSGLQRGYLRFEGLPANDPKKSQYQLWIFDSTRDAKYPVDGGVFDVDASGEVVVPITAALPVRTATLFAVTVEAPGGVVVSSREHIVLTASPGG